MVLWQNLTYLGDSGSPIVCCYEIKLNIIPAPHGNHRVRSLPHRRHPAGPSNHHLPSNVNIYRRIVVAVSGISGGMEAPKSVNVCVPDVLHEPSKTKGCYLAPHEPVRTAGRGADMHSEVEAELAGGRGIVSSVRRMIDHRTLRIHPHKT